MIDRWIWRILMLPFTVLYGIGVGLKSLAYRTELLKGVRFNIPVISVGNLNVGGSGKTPHVEHLVRILSPYVPVATLSRGYKRKTSGFLLVRPNMRSEATGDEPLMYARKYPHIAVAVSESRSLGIPRLLQKFPQIRVIILDDAFQHRAVEPSLNILLTEYANPYYDDWLLPSGTLREFRQASSRADIIIVTKCPESLSVEEGREIIGRIHPNALQKVFFTRYVYGTPYSMTNGSDRKRIENASDVLAVCGIARSEYLEQYLTEQAGTVRVMKYSDHHKYSASDVADIINFVKGMDSDRRMLVTTEKDAVRLEGFLPHFREAGIQIWVLPIRVEFLFDHGTIFEDTLRTFLLNFKV